MLLSLPSVQLNQQYYCLLYTSFTIPKGVTATVTLPGEVKSKDYGSGTYKAVSYTHLDVYKRQMLSGLDSILFCWQTVSVISHWVEYIEALDVYKRQVVSFTSCIAGGIDSGSSVQGFHFQSRIIGKTIQMIRCV